MSGIQNISEVFPSIGNLLVHSHLSYKEISLFKFVKVLVAYEKVFILFIFFGKITLLFESA